MNELVSAPISPWYSIPASVGLLAFTFAFAPGVLLHLGVLIYPKDHARRREFRAELYAVPFIKRPFWVASTLVRCLFEGLAARIQAMRLRRTRRVPRMIQEYGVDGALKIISEGERYLDLIPPWRRYTPRNVMLANALWDARREINRLRKDPPA